jgi:hypothetical protein
MEEEEEAVKPGSKKGKVCSSVQDPIVRPCAHAPMRPCHAKYALALWTYVCSRHGASRPAGLPCTQEDGNIWCHW